MFKRARSVTREQKYFAVAASPFNAVKLALGLIIVVGVLLILLTGNLTANPMLQMFVLGSYGVISAFWLILKTRRIAQSHIVTFHDKSSTSNELEK